jgi:hypothetical protein
MGKTPMYVCDLTNRCRLFRKRPRQGGSGFPGQFLLLPAISRMESIGDLHFPRPPLFWIRYGRTLLA